MNPVARVQDIRKKTMISVKCNLIGIFFIVQICKDIYRYVEKISFKDYNYYFALENDIIITHITHFGITSFYHLIYHKLEKKLFNMVIHNFNKPCLKVQIIDLLLSSNSMMMIRYMGDFVFFELNERVSV